MSKHFIDASEVRITGNFSRDEDGEILVSVADIRRSLQMAPAANVVEIPEGHALLPVTRTELKHLMNDIIAYMWRLENRECATEEFGYCSRKELLDKLKAFEKEHFPDNDSCNT